MASSKNECLYLDITPTAAVSYRVDLTTWELAPTSVGPVGSSLETHFENEADTIMYHDAAPEVVEIHLDDSDEDEEKRSTTETQAVQVGEHREEKLVAVTQVVNVEELGVRIVPKSCGVTIGRRIICCVRRKIARSPTCRCKTSSRNRERAAIGPAGGTLLDETIGGTPNEKSRKPRILQAFNSKRRRSRDVEEAEAR